MIGKDHRWADRARDLLPLRAQRLIVRHPKLDDPSLLVVLVPSIHWLGATWSVNLIRYTPIHRAREAVFYIYINV